MIAFVRGTIASVGLDTAVVEVGGVGMEVRAAPATLAELRVGATAKLPTSLVVREDSLTLYGFADDDERAVFELLQTASGVGPRLAQAMLAVHRPDELRRAVATEDLTALTKVPGIGRKGAQRIVLELKDRLGAPIGGSAGAGAALPVAGVAPGAAWRDQVRGALLGLGWSAREAESALDAVAPMAEEMAAGNGADGANGAKPTNGGGAPDVAALLRAALRTLSRA
ncbi:holliday junction DNA helicase RuvA [Actinopolymorpha cephalotaxi]|uniref:Holliday junction branch migration complex subunit RuvA n=1 Tax=Actinopolymorpha cephalotaxi TaxID=504797 RepID=A0A1I2PT08_9ACTN|nr:Holliday junction branch migration protein RuvA [Actinopolymorpha cephalotaxi]NYH83484.1 Holliday junction DNA helicase RuvA [Actinopolymorpha cephalotaxi]SFG19184.1 holliday junction DNA helicase RuvA [Actinopolymorpha cephalotaxi]